MRYRIICYRTVSGVRVMAELHTAGCLGKAEEAARFHWMMHDDGEAEILDNVTGQRWEIDRQAGQLHSLTAEVQTAFDL